ncbi:di-trans,poly-cis-decaprenylcistransferase [Patescibacteria group bacterium]|nr:di-trans,poly-cis-decaprenylcistransferase [Patescibacteria group bacterium]MBU1123539.1 di-trans,poly-cis-decaprenylcistransferase [Patescibacteria group bacterium]MBU1911562.1 di-trans,poly-cis-decaprenylcistransferase [Patescibacteria group bacterium]
MDKPSSLHLAIIPDGNRRWAKNRSLHPWKGHEQAIENFRSITEWCRNDPRVNILTVWCFSTENWKRDPKEIEMLMKMLEDYLRKEQEGFIEKKTKSLHSGRKDRIPSSLAQLIEEVEKKTADQSEFTLHLAVDYGGKDEIIRAINKISVTEDCDLPLRSENGIREHLDHPELSDIDLIIRTSGEQRTSNFFLWQTVHSEWVFNNKLFPDFEVSDLESAVDDFANRTRRFGS